MQVSQTNPPNPTPINQPTNQPPRKAPSSHPELRQGGVQVYMHRWDWSLSQAKLVGKLRNICPKWSGKEETQIQVRSFRWWLLWVSWVFLPVCLANFWTCKTAKLFNACENREDLLSLPLVSVWLLILARFSSSLGPHQCCCHNLLQALCGRSATYKECQEKG